MIYNGCGCCCFSSGARICMFALLRAVTGTVVDAGRPIVASIGGKRLFIDALELGFVWDALYEKCRPDEPSFSKRTSLSRICC